MHSDDEINERIKLGLIPPHPDYVSDHERWRRWYAENVRCVTSGHAYFVRERSTKTCRQCNAAGNAVPMMAAINAPKHVRKPRPMP
jgi:hypothetical protein